MRKTSVLLVVVVALLLAACGGQSGSSSSTGGSTASAGNAANGEKLFNQATIGKDNLPGCKTCHSLVKDQKLVGPSLAGIATDAANTVKEADYKGTAKTAEEWLRESITNPNVDVPEGHAPNVMPQNFKDELTPDQINDLVAFLMTQK
jgi:nitric oxide reductase subunit C